MPNKIYKLKIKIIDYNLRNFGLQKAPPKLIQYELNRKKLSVIAVDNWKYKTKS